MNRDKPTIQHPLNIQQNWLIDNLSDILRQNNILPKKLEILDGYTLILEIDNATKCCDWRIFKPTPQEGFVNICQSIAQRKHVPMSHFYLAALRRLDAPPNAQIADFILNMFGSNGSEYNTTCFGLELNADQMVSNLFHLVEYQYSTYNMLKLSNPLLQELSIVSSIFWKTWHKQNNPPNKGKP